MGDEFLTENNSDGLQIDMTGAAFRWQWWAVSFRQKTTDGNKGNGLQTKNDICREHISSVHQIRNNSGGHQIDNDSSGPKVDYDSGGIKVENDSGGL